MKRKLHYANHVFITMIIFVCFAFLVNASAQQPYEIQITNVDQTVYKNFLGIPKTVDYKVSWRVMKNQDGQYVDADITELQNFELLYTKDDSTFRRANTVRVGQVDSAKVSDLKVGDKYFFRVQAVDQNNQIYQSQVAWRRSGKPADMGAVVNQDEESSWIWYLPISGRFPLTILGYGDVFDKATLLGKFAFHIIWWFLIFGVITVINCFRLLRLGKIFPFSPFSFKSVISPLNYEFEFQKRKKKEFFGEGGIIHKWKQVIESVSSLLDKPPRMEGASTLDIDKLRTRTATWWRDEGREYIHKIQEDIDEYVKYPTARIIRAGLSNHEINGFKFMEASEEVDRAIENRAMMELEQLKGNSRLEWLWNLAATAPLIGLFGTVTGISVAFRKLAVQSERGIVDTTSKISELAGGINEALWTTIFGLVIGIVLALFYYLFKNKLDWIYAKWEEIYVDVSEKL